VRIVRHTQNYSYEVWNDNLGEHLNITKERPGFTEEVDISGYGNLMQLRDDLTRLLESTLVD